MKKDHADKLIAAYLAGDISTSEERDLMAWVDSSSDNQKFFDQAINIWQAAEDYVFPDFNANKEEAFRKLDQRLVQEGGQAKVRHLSARRSGRRWLSVAAAVALLLTAGWWWQSQTIETATLVAQTQLGEQQTVLLPDGTEVWLNEDSELSYEEHDTERYISFRGEAYFQVATDSLRPFRIYSGQAVTTVLGTAFNLRAYPNEPQVEVSVTEGRVALARNEAEISDAPSERVELDAGKVGVFQRETAKVETKTAVSIQNNLAWKEQVLNFEGIPLRHAIQDLERYFDISIEVIEPDMLDCTLQVSEFQKPKLEEMLSLLQFSFEFEIEQQAERIILRGGQCQ